jgi:RNA recognition motif. (a.k.a. RRM, RBD, or RNP domain)
VHPLTCVSLLQAKLPPGANRILFVKNLNYQITGEDLYDLFGRYGSIRKIRIGNEPKTKGTAFVVFDDVMDVRSLFYISPSPPVSTDSFHDRLRMHWNI